jgi:hypothetical protein
VQEKKNNPARVNCHENYPQLRAQFPIILNGEYFKNDFTKKG